MWKILSYGRKLLRWVRKGGVGTEIYDTIGFESLYLSGGYVYSTGTWANSGSSGSTEDLSAVGTKPTLTGNRVIFAGLGELQGGSLTYATTNVQTLACVIKCTNISASWQEVVGKRRCRIRFNPFRTSLQFGLQNWEITGEFALTEDVWYAIVMVADATTEKYKEWIWDIDAGSWIRQGTEYTVTDIRSPVYGEFRIGGNTAGNQYWEGEIKECGISSAGASDSEAEDLIERLKSI
jgi:hypothetical protein